MAPRQTTFRLTLRSNPRHIGRVEDLLKKLNRTLHLGDIQFHKLMVSLTEAVNNAIIHGNRSDETKKVAIRCRILPGWLVMTVTDQGSGFRLSRVRNPLMKKNLLRESGRGIFLMRTLMDRVEFRVQKTGSEVELWLDLTK
ncbi:MAG: ATP-binding protein [Bacteroidota bacterium]